MNIESLEAIANALAAKGKGILAADESAPTIKKRLTAINVEANEENARVWRELIFTTKGLGEAISGIILFDETLRQSTTDGRRFADVLDEAGIIPGIKVDKGGKQLVGHADEKVTEGLDGLRERFEEYYQLGARFSKWRAIIDIDDNIPSRTCLKVNAHALARYAALSQEAGLVPIVEPEVLMDGSHDINRCAEVTEAALEAVFAELVEQGVHLEGMLLKPNMVVSGLECSQTAMPEEVARLTLRTLKRRVPAAVPGLVFLSGGQSEVQATENLNAMNLTGPHPWQLSFSYGRALQQSGLKAWSGEASNIPMAQKVLMHRAHMNSLARSGSYTAQEEQVDL
jgi:fructose-bisphosphate aldolase, class I